MRTLDVGGDKALPYFTPPKEDNPFMGWRSVRVSLDNREIFQTQIEAGIDRLRRLEIAANATPVEPDAAQVACAILQDAADRIVAELFNEPPRSAIIVQSNKPGATITLDGDEVGTTGSEPV